MTQTTSAVREAGSVGICPWELAHLLDFGRVKLIDVRDPLEYAECHIFGAVPLPLACLSSTSAELADASHVVFCCKTGRRSAQAVDLLRNSQFRGCVSQLRGGLQAWVAEGLFVCGKVA